MKRLLILIVVLMSTINLKAQEQVGVESIGTNDGVPVGTIVASILDPFQFMTSAKSNWPVTNPRDSKSKWVPADGRVIEGSIYFRITDQSTVPDLRGMFLRGLNEFEVQKNREDGKQDPDGQNRKAGDYQADAIKVHDHGIDAPTNFNSNGGNSGSNRWFGKKGEFTKLNRGGANETRPKNVAVYYYIKIN